MSPRTGFKLLGREAARLFVNNRSVLQPSPVRFFQKMTFTEETGGSTPGNMSILSPSVKEMDLQSVIFQPEVVIFDKDGTLVCFHTMWNSWCEQLAYRMRSVMEKDMDDSVYQLLGYDNVAKKVRMGLLAEKTHPYIKEKLEELLVKEGFSSWEARNVVTKTWKDTPENMQIKSTGNLRTLFSRLKENNIKIAICTSDSREGTQEFLERMSLTDLVDLVVCGDDPESISKPDPHNARFICEKLNARLSDTIMVGDTPADTIMGQSANLGLTIGVLTGVGSEADLSHADIILKDITQVVDLITPSKEEHRESHNVMVTARGLNKIAERSCFS
ncbi:uncharacterized protein LOC111703400 [Eurytemora carolleeae]|uniref:uncharacterized protein LOC111703400 n=1 Tax=Eurytemora carolleeae TaxID=1294199 RepID=UPI000C77611F|nr:uncharacterized protein LOC111703400 [Eurytemora carolleeae]|eukprot:XP_023331100.1 uncharacterized protein LOC111703400 [Eurytemora affinis]